MAGGALTRRVGESGRTYYSDFKLAPEIVGGDTLASVTSVTSAPAGQTIGTGVITGTQVHYTVTGTIIGAYTITCNAVTTAGVPLSSVYTMNVSP